MHVNWILHCLENIYYPHVNLDHKIVCTCIWSVQLHVLHCNYWSREIAIHILQEAIFLLPATKLGYMYQGFSDEEKPPAVASLWASFTIASLRGCQPNAVKQFNCGGPHSRKQGNLHMYDFECACLLPSNDELDQLFDNAFYSGTHTFSLRS